MKQIAGQARKDRNNYLSANHRAMLFRIAFLLLLLSAQCRFAAAQTAAAISGPFQTDLEAVNKRYMSVSPDGSRVAFYEGGNHLGTGGRLITFLVDAGKFSVSRPAMTSPQRSEDLMMECYNGTGESDARFGDPKTWPGKSPLGRYENGFVIYKNGEPKPIHFQGGGDYLHYVTADRQLLLSQYRPDTLSSPRTLRVNIGLWLADFTGKKIKQLRSDTVFIVKSHWSVFPNPNKTALIRMVENHNWDVQFLPFGSDSVVTMAGLKGRPHYDPEFADDHYLYVPDDHNSDLSVWSLHTGKLLFKKERKTAVVSEYSYRRCRYAEAPGEGIYTFDLEKGKLYHEAATGNDMRVLQEWSLDTSNFPLAPNQAYKIAVCKGPSLLIVPAYRKKSAGPDNIGYLIDLNTGKPKLTIAPFFTPEGALLAQEAASSKAVAQANAASRARDSALAVQKAASKLADCEADLKAKGLVVGASVTDGKESGILTRFDCKTGKAYVAVPYYLNVQQKPADLEVRGDYFRAIWKRAPYDWVSCPLCNGKGWQEVSETKTNTHELPQGYFSGIRTTKTTTWTETSKHTCKGCGGLGQVKKKSE